jgi:hypothetical protein
MQLAAADPSGDQSLVWRAAGRLGIPIQAGTPAVEAGLAEFGGQVRFRHPLARSAAYRSAAFADRQQLHAALAEVTDPLADPDRRAWHRAQAAPAWMRKSRSSWSGRLTGPGPGRTGRRRGVPGTVGTADGRSGPAG